MARILVISVEDVTIRAELFDTETADALYEAAPFSSEAQSWGEEIYFDIPLALDQESEAREEVTIGDLGYWPMGAALCIFFGPTPVSQGTAPRAYSPVNVFGRVMGDAKAFRTVSEGARIRVELGS